MTAIRPLPIRGARRGHRWLPLIAGLLAVGAGARPAAAQQQPPWSPEPPPAAQPPASEGGGPLLQVLAGVGIGGAVATTLMLTSPDGRGGEAIIWSAIALTPAGVGFAVCNLGRRSERSEPSCARTVIAAYVGSLVAVPVFLAAFMAELDWCGCSPQTKSDEDQKVAVILGATSVAWVAGMTAGATIFGRRRIPPRVSAPPPPSPWPVGFAPADDPRRPRWAGGRVTGQLVFPLLSLAF